MCLKHSYQADMHKQQQKQKKMKKRQQEKKDTIKVSTQHLANIYDYVNKTLNWIKLSCFNTKKDAGCV